MVKQACRSTVAPVNKFINTQRVIEKEKGAGSISKDTVAGGVIYGTADEA